MWELGYSEETMFADDIMVGRLGMILIIIRRHTIIITIKQSLSNHRQFNLN